MIQRSRPQIMLSIIAATIFAIFCAWLGFKMGAIEVLTGLIGAVFGYLAGVSAKILEAPEG